MDIEDDDLKGSRFERVDLRDSSFRATDLSGSTFRGVGLHHVVMRGVELAHVEISGELLDVRVNGVDIAPLVEAELDRLDPQRPLMRPTDAQGFRHAWQVLDGLWAATVARARALDPALLHVSVAGEWSFVETLRHLVFATDSWVGRAVLGDPSPWHPLDLPWDEMPDIPGVPRDREVRPDLDVALGLRRDRWAMVRDYLAGLTDTALAADTEPVEGPGWPPGQSFPVRECLLIVLNEEWSHRLFAERDLAALESGSVETASR